jgi:adenylylsulfate kinase
MNNLYKYAYRINKQKRIEKNGHQSPVIWFTGLSGSGKSTLANSLESYLFENGYKTYVLDADNVRMGLNRDLGFSDVDRKENIRRISEVANLFSDSGTLTLTAFISPFKEDRQIARDIIGDGFIEVYVKADLSVCEKRDPKGLYKKARLGEIKDFTGISSPFESPSRGIMLKNNTEEDLNFNVKFLTELIVKNNK